VTAAVDLGDVLEGDRVSSGARGRFVVGCGVDGHAKSLAVATPPGEGAEPVSAVVPRCPAARTGSRTEALLGGGGSLDRDHTAPAALAELHDPRPLGEDRVVLADPDA